MGVNYPGCLSAGYDFARTRHSASLWLSVSTAVMRRRVAQGQADQEAQMFERSEFLRLPLDPSNAACPER